MCHYCTLLPLSYQGLWFVHHQGNTQCKLSGQQSIEYFLDGGQTTVPNKEEEAEYSSGTNCCSEGSILIDTNSTLRL